MDYHYVNSNSNTDQINMMDYWSLVNMLMTQITPDVRKKILERLVEMNNTLIMSLSLPIPTPISVPAQLSVSNPISPQVSVSGPHTSPVKHTIGQSPVTSQYISSSNLYQSLPSIPSSNMTNMSIISNKNSGLTNTSSNMANISQYILPPKPKSKAQTTQQVPQSQSQSQSMRKACGIIGEPNVLSWEKDKVDKINVDEIVGDDLDLKLANIKKLYTKIMTDKRRKKQEQARKH